MRKTAMMCAMVVICAMFTGCAALQNLFNIAKDDPRARYVLAKEGFTGVVRTLTVLADQDVFSASDLERIDVSVTRGHQVLSDWNEALLRGESYKGGTTLVLGIVNELLPYYQKGGKK